MKTRFVKYYSNSNTNNGCRARASRVKVQSLGSFPGGFDYNSGPC